METPIFHASNDPSLSLLSDIEDEQRFEVDDLQLFFLDDPFGNPTQPGNSPSSFNYSSPSQSESALSDLRSIDFSAIVPMTNQTVALQQVKPIEQLRIIAQPKTMYRERYTSETDGTRNRPSRFIRAEGGHPDNLEYPTIEIPAIWRNWNRKLYIRVTLVTVPNDKAPVVCIHPYGIDTKDIGVIKYPENLSQFGNKNEHYYHWLFYPVNNKELNNGRKSFHIIRKKMLQDHLKKYGPLQMYDSESMDIDRVENMSNPKHVIKIYELYQSQLVFTLVEYMSNNTLQPISTTSVISQIMYDEKIKRKNLIVDGNSSSLNENSVRYAPIEGNWDGGDEVLMFIPNLDRRQAWNLYFDYGQQGELQNIPTMHLDMKTISFQTPRCPLLTQDCDVDIPIVVIQSETIIAQINFRYLAHKKNEFGFFPI